MSGYIIMFCTVLLFKRKKNEVLYTFTKLYTPNRDTDSCVLKLGDIHLREQKTILLKLCLPKLKENVINIHLEYFDMKQSSKDTTAILTVRRSGKNLIYASISPSSYIS